MPFTKETAAKAGARSKRGKSTEQRAMRIALLNMIEKHRDRFEKEFDQLQGKEFMNYFIQLLEYVQPKLNRVDIASDDENPVNISLNPICFIKTDDRNK